MKNKKEQKQKANEVKEKKHKMSKGELAVKIIAILMAILMLGSICISTVYSILYFFTE